MGLVAQRRLVAVGALLLTVFAIWRAGIGADFGDGTHVVALAMRMAQGDMPLADEMNLQALGSLPAVPFTWVWLSTVGVDGIVLASRLWYVALALLAGVLGYRALRTGFGPVGSFVAVTLMMLPTPYSLLVTSYNTVPVLGLALATCTAFAAWRVRSGRWAALSGVALALTALAHPAMVPPAMVLLAMVVVVGRGPVARGVLTGALGTALVIVVAVALGPGVGALGETLRYTAEYQSARLTAFERLTLSAEMHRNGLLVWRNVPALLLAVAAGLPWTSQRWRALLATGSVVALSIAVVGASLQQPPTEELLLGSVAAALVVLAAVLLLPFLVTARDLGEDRLRVLLVLTAPTAVVGFVAVSLVSSASAKWGVAAAPVQPLFGAAALVVLLFVARHHVRAVALLAALALLGSLVVVHPMRSFRDVQPHRLDGRVEDGPLAGLLTHEAYLQEDCELRAAVRDWVDPDDSVFFWAAPAGYVYADAPMSTHNIWVADFGAASAAGVEWMTRTDRWPDVAFVHAGALASAGGWEALAARDPVIARLDAHYGEPTEVDGFVVLRRDGGVRADGPAPQGC
ncbi:hypothetical protein MWU75_01680 [Ornithinimicrobium sp. F0845]|uniref:hypothetical protein n=1 Tax=Ornithinimicrobium sp. F0845 TaxID=2926412 RepID=UPI001FF3991A|nr:hypothetical protein [Ornithinimicrobium sp. F0845]MCK0110853.1 hypothetical protein [Ornithinimicrobium sp. F0845]